MGHANVGNLCEFVVEEIHTQGELSFAAAVKLAMERGLTLNASEGAYDDVGSLELGLSIVFSWLESKAIIFKADKRNLRWRFTGIGLSRYPCIPRLEYIDV